MSPKNFKDELTDRLLDLHWKQWTAFGVSSQLNRSREYILDLEALIVSTLTIGRLNLRLFEAALEWTQVNRPWLNLFRIKRIGKFFTSREIDQKKPLLNSQLTDIFTSFVKNPRTLWSEWENRINDNNYAQDDFLELFYNYEERGIVVEPDILSPCLLQLHVRNFFGVDARAEMFLYFLAGKMGNSNSISGEIFLEQKNLYRILNNWVEAEIIEEDLKVSSPDYGLKNRELWMQTFQINEIPTYVNWPRIYKFMDSITVNLADPAIGDDTYLVSSFFKDKYSDAQYAASVTKIDLPSPKSFPGKEYYEPFANSLLQIADKIMR
jgi:hypothetical protein